MDYLIELCRCYTEPVTEKAVPCVQSELTIPCPQSDITVNDMISQSEMKIIISSRSDIKWDRITVGTLPSSIIIRYDTLLKVIRVPEEFDITQATARYIANTIQVILPCKYKPMTIIGLPIVPASAESSPVLEQMVSASLPVKSDRDETRSIRSELPPTSQVHI